ncbi:MAG TPA: alpha/beta fold hydrolase [Bryobacteraceae bacterium]|nr:alpha/beta fold hydrolase [Bryobacteraceae bacterium]
MLAAQPAGKPEQVARKALDLLLAEKYTELRIMLTPAAQEKLTLDFLHDRVGGEIRTFGQLNSIGAPVTAQDGDNTLVSFPAQFAAAKINIQLTLNPSLQVAGLYLRPPEAPLPKVWQRPPYSRPDSFTQREVTIGADEWKLGGTLTMPTGKGPFPGLVLVPGPGPNNRDEEIYSNRIFRDIAEGLSSRGIAVLRYDKRTLTYGDKMGDIAFTIDQETVDDAVRALDLMRHQPGIAANRVYLLGHSLGGYAAPRIAGRDGKLAGIIFLAANARPIEDVALDQNEYIAHLNGDPSPQMQARLDALRAEVARVKAIEPGKPVPQILMGLPGLYLLDLKNYNPAAQARELTIPLLFLQGGRDFQVTSKDFDLWKTALAGKTNAEFKEYPALNNLFISGDGKPGPSDYLKQGNVDPAVIDDIAAWIAHPGK